MTIHMSVGTWPAALSGPYSSEPSSHGYFFTVPLTFNLDVYDTLGVLR